MSAQARRLVSGGPKKASAAYQRKAHPPHAFTYLRLAVGARQAAELCKEKDCSMGLRQGRLYLSCVRPSRKEATQS